MNIHVTGKQLPVSQALREHAERRLASGAEKYFSDAIEAHVVFSPEGQRVRADCAVHVGHGIDAHAHAVADEAQASLELACEKLEKRLRRFKRRLRDHRQRQRERQEAAFAAPAYVLRSEPEPAADLESGEPELTHPDIVEEGTADILVLSLAEAVMRVELSDQPVLFRSERHGGINLVYRRPDGRIGWVDPSPDGR